MLASEKRSRGTSKTEVVACITARDKFISFRFHERPFHDIHRARCITKRKENLPSEKIMTAPRSRCERPNTQRCDGACVACMRSARFVGGGFGAVDGSYGFTLNFGLLPPPFCLEVHHRRVCTQNRGGGRITERKHTKRSITVRF